MVVGLFGNESPDSNRFTLVTPKPENGVRLQATLLNQNPTGLPVGAVRFFYVVLNMWRLSVVFIELLGVSGKIICEMYNQLFILFVNYFYKLVWLGPSYGEK